MAKINLFNITNHTCPACGEKMHVEFDDGDIYDVRCLCGVMVYVTSDGNYDAFQADPDPSYFMVKSQATQAVIIRLVPNYMSLNHAIAAYVAEMSKNMKAYCDTDAELHARLNEVSFVRSDSEAGMTAIKEVYNKALSEDMGNLCISYTNGDALFSDTCHDDFMDFRSMYLELKEQGEKAILLYSFGQVDDEYSLPLQIRNYTLMPKNKPVVAKNIFDPSTVSCPKLPY